MSQVDEPTPSENGSRNEPSAGQQAGKAARGVLGLVASAVRIITGLFALILLINIVLLLLGANPFNAAAQFVFVVANALTLGLGNLFLLASPIWQVIVSYGLPAIVWLLIGAVIVAILRAVARPGSGLR